jgi:hypothetical protein
MPTAPPDMPSIKNLYVLGLHRSHDHYLCVERAPVVSEQETVIGFRGRKEMLVYSLPTVPWIATVLQAESNTRSGGFGS